jgi:anti-sigma factor RsiW
MCPDQKHLHAYFDAELDAQESMEVARHVQGCPACHAEIEQLTAARRALRTQFSGVRAPQPLRAAIERALDAEQAQVAAPARHGQASWRTRPFWLGALGGMGGALAAAALVFLILSAPRAALLDQLVTAHVQSLAPGHLIGVVSTDRHTVKPWFAGRTDVSPVVADFAEQGYRLVGGRADAIAHQRAAVLIYQHGAHYINVFSWKDTDAPPADATRSGYHMAFWRVGDLNYCAVSDTGWTELKGLEQLLKTTGEQELKP